MKKPITQDNDLPVEGQDFAKPEDDQQQQPSHGEVNNQKGSDFSELEESRMENPPEHRETNGSDKNDTDSPLGEVKQEKGVK